MESSSIVCQQHCQPCSTSTLTYTAPCVVLISLAAPLAVRRGRPDAIAHVAGRSPLHATIDQVAEKARVIKPTAKTSGTSMRHMSDCKTSATQSSHWFLMQILLCRLVKRLRLLWSLHTECCNASSSALPHPSHPNCPSSRGQSIVGGFGSTLSTVRHSPVCLLPGPNLPEFASPPHHQQRTLCSVVVSNAHVVGCV